MLYYLKDMALVGYGFVAKGVIHDGLFKTVIIGDLYHNGKKFTAKVHSYKSRRPAALVDVMGEDSAHAEENLKKVVAHMDQCISLNVNNIQKTIFSRFLFHSFKAIVTIAALCMVVFSISKFISSGYDLSYLVCIVASIAVEFICFITNNLTE